MDHQYLQVLRSIDKIDKIGRDGVIALLQRPTEDFGANLNPVAAGIVGLFLDTKGATDAETVNHLKSFFRHARRVRSRVDLLAVLETSVEPDGTTKWDRLIALRPNADETWNDGGRPANIGWALDDMLAEMED